MGTEETDVGSEAADAMTGTTPPPAPPAPAAPAGPWDEALATKFADATQREAVSEFLREQVQPYVTKQEQESASSPGNRLWEDFKEDSDQTFVKVATELYGREQAEKIISALKDEADEIPAKNVDSDPFADLDKVKVDELPEEVQALIEKDAERSRQEQWDTIINDVKEANPDLPFDEDLFRPFVIASEGDVDQALTAYKEWGETGTKLWTKESAEETAAEGVAAEAAEKAPPTLGNKTGTAPPKISKSPETLDQAIDEIFTEISAANAPPPTV